MPRLRTLKWGCCLVVYMLGGSLSTLSTFHIHLNVQQQHKTQPMSKSTQLQMLAHMCQNDCLYRFQARMNTIKAELMVWQNFYLRHQSWKEAPQNTVGATSKKSYTSLHSYYDSCRSCVAEYFSVLYNFWQDLLKILFPFPSK